MQKLAIPIAICALCILFYEFSASVEIISGVALFLFGMLVMQDGFKMLSGGFLEGAMKTATNSTLKSILFGAVATTFMQSSTLVSLFAISFVSAGIISLIQGVGIILGSNLGNSTGAWIIALIGNKANISSFALPIIAFGVVFLFHKLKAVKGFGYVLAGIGFVFLGIAYIKIGFDSYKEVLDFTRYNMSGFGGMLIFFLVGTMATLIMQSTHATLVLIMATLSTGQMSLESGMVLSIGAQFGSSITTGLGALNASIDGKRLAVAHISFNLITALIAVILYEPFLWITEFASNALHIADINLKVAMFLTIFNVLRIALIIPLLKRFVYYLVRFVRERKSGDLDSPIYLDESKVEFANASLEAITNETKHLYDNALGIISRSIGFDRAQIRSFEPIENLLKNKKILKDEIDINALYENKVKSLSNAIMEFTARAKTKMGQESQMKEVFALQMANKCIVSATQQMRLLQKNLQKHSLSRNESLSSEYNQMRGALANLLRAIEELRITDIEENMQVAKNKIAKYKAFFKYDDLQIISKIDALVAGKSISIAESTTMLNDLSIMRQIALSLVEAIGYLYGVEI